MNKLKAINFNFAPPLANFIRQYRIDILIIVGLAIAIAISTYIGTYKLPTPLFTDLYAQDVWFGGDIPTVFGNLTSLNSDFGRNNKHPLFPLIVFPLVFLTGKLFHLDPLAAARLVAVGVSTFWIGALYALFRIMGCYRLDATLLSLVGAVSAASIFWLIIPESFPLASLTFILGLAFVTLAQFRPFTGAWYIAINVITVSITITNSMVGILATLVNNRWKKAIQIFVGSLLLATGLWILQRIVFTNSGFPFQPGTFIGEKKFIATPSGGILSFLSAFFYQTMVMPATQFGDFAIRPDWIKIEANLLAPASGSLWGTAAIVSWTALLGLGLWAFATIKQHNKLRIVLGLTLLAQLGMHSIYGADETFIYSLHFIPLLLTVVAFSLLTRLRIISLILAVILIVSAGINNRTQFTTIAANLWNYGTPQQQVEAQIKLRPDDFGLRNAGHVVLASPTSSTTNKSFHDIGGSFSPQAGSFGVSIWVVDRQGNIKTTSDRLPVNEIQQQFTDFAPQKAPKILTKTKYYEASWSLPKAGIWQLNLKSLTSADDRLVIAIRSVGPAGAAIPSLDWNGNRLLISDRWVIKDIPKQAKVYLGSESTSGWSREQSNRSQWQDPHGWGYARIELNPSDNASVLIEDNQAIADIETPSTALTSNLVLDLPDPQFVDSLKSQIAHLTMGIVGNRTYPTDPVSYPLSRFRDGAYQMVALARAGQLDLAKQLSPYFAENDFINSTLPEADIPALGIWALEEVAIALKQPDYDRWLWSHIQRKAKLIGDMLATNRPGYPILSAAKFPFAENSELVRVDLSSGKMENVPNAINIDPSANVISYRALLDAATLADRLKQSESAKLWRLQAEKLKAVWQKDNPISTQSAPQQPKSKAPQPEFSAFTDGLWPSGIAEGDRNALNQVFQKRWEGLRDKTGAFRPSTPSMQANIAEAHQWVMLDQPDRLWQALKWIWQNQASSGLYTWASDRDDPSDRALPKSFSQWQRLRGRVNPTQLTPHYWTSAEMLLLQLDMLSYVNRSTNTPTLIIGAGIPKDWLNKSISIKNQLLDGNLVDWNWDGKQINVQIKGESLDIKLGSSFPNGTQLKVEILPKESKESKEIPQVKQ
ncbi:hypothetical protein [Pseudanabaena yagii]|uniref:Glycosyltransferase RgtA/B/C/D-like domain-containing protein n=1 Tax=Pseudanabaena yagii GIHE-NHR1 TaxID=2722753 RepID=A0ABX1M0K0_9CYAN|nr:hypothetical protein [Pseudanabaena yagii]NMF60554.1 hypothetical protein [Pseudanabaena yagii GIHE-NHR1]